MQAQDVAALFCGRLQKRLSNLGVMSKGVTSSTENYLHLWLVYTSQWLAAMLIKSLSFKKKHWCTIMDELVYIELNC